VEAFLVVTPDGTVTVEGDVRSEGTARVTGTVAVEDPVSNPKLNLSIEAENFLAVNRRDVEGHLSGSVNIRGSYRRPTIGGDLTVDEGVLRVEEVARSVEVVDLSDPAFFDVVDTAQVTLRPSFQGNPNPFLQNLRLDDLTLTMAQDGWLRGRELNVEMAGTLDVYWDRTERNLAFLGVLDAVRGVYTVFGRQFQVQEGTVSFPGTPGINPDLSIRALNRVRISGNTQLDILATVEGPLLEPRVALSSNAAFSIAESDLVSYLVFGRPSYATASAQRNFAEDAAGMFAGAASSLAVGLFSSELGTILAEDVGLDYLAVTQGNDETLGIRALGGTMATTQVEIGQYLTEDIFAALHWRPFSGRSGSRSSQLAALRIESRLSDRWTLEGYWEDRFLRTPLYQVGSLGFDLEPVVGFFLYRQWGY
jgi:autotransporter translocation and assembly factor TamB